MLSNYQHLPQLINPIAFSIGSFSVRWYSISYVVGFLFVYFALMKSLKNNNVKDWNLIFGKNRNNKHEMQNLVLDFLLLNFFAALAGGRMGYVLFYDFSYFISYPLSIISPFSSGKFIGFYGMSYHGALLAMILVSYIFLRFKKIDFLVWTDFIIPAVPLGYFFGRLGNFLNGELYGRVTDSSLGMYFLSDSRVLRHPSQIYEAIGEGLILFLIILKAKKMKLSAGSLLAVYLIGYSAIRFLLEFFRQPDAQTGFYFNLFTIGQLLSFIMFGAGMVMLVRFNRAFLKVNKFFH